MPLNREGFVRLARAILSYHRCSCWSETGVQPGALGLCAFPSVSGSGLGRSFVGPPVGGEIGLRVAQDLKDGLPVARRNSGKLGIGILVGEDLVEALEQFVAH